MAVPMYKRSMMILLVLVMLAAAGMLYGYNERDHVVLLDAATTPKDAEVSERDEIMVYVTGAVNRPGVIHLPAGARTADAVNACGGVLPTADMAAINMAQPLKDGVQIRVPEKAAGGSQTMVPAKDGLVNINTADEKTLDTLPGIGPAMAKRILEYRQTNGSFQAVEELKKVRGIGDAKFDKLKDRITL